MTTIAPPTSFSALLHFLDRLERANISYRLEHVRDSVMVTLALPGEWWEVEFFEDGQVEIERFISTGGIDDASILDQLFQEHPV